MANLYRSDLTEGFKRLGLRAGDTLLVHSSLKSLGYVEGGVTAVIDSIMDVVGEGGTLIVPTLTGKREDSKNNPPIFDVLETSCWTGIIPETVRKMQKAKRSLHPTHSASAIGLRSGCITEGHENSKSPCDEESPYYKNAVSKGYVMLIGVDQESNTSIHSCEEIAGVPYHLQKDITDTCITGYSGEKIKVSNKLHDWDKPATDFNKLDSIYKGKGIMTVGRVGNADIRLINACNMFEFTIGLLKKEPLFLLA